MLGERSYDGWIAWVHWGRSEAGYNENEEYCSGGVIVRAHGGTPPSGCGDYRLENRREAPNGALVGNGSYVPADAIVLSETET